MAEAITMSLSSVDINTLRKRVADSKSASTARYYNAMLNRLEEYNQSPTLDLAKVTSEYVSSFGEYLVRQGVTLSTCKLFKMAFRAIMKDAFGPDFRSQFKEVFKGVGSKNEIAKNGISFEDLRKIANCNLTSLVVLDRARNVFLYCLVSGGINLHDLKKQIETATVDQDLPQQKMLIGGFRHISEKGFNNYVTKLEEDQYRQTLEAIGVYAGVSTILKPESALNGWIACAMKANISNRLIASMLPDGETLLGINQTSTRVSDADRHEILLAAANTIIDMKPRWYAMKCISIMPTGMDEEIAKAGILSDDDCFASFLPPEHKLPKGKGDAKKSIISEMYFFNCKCSTAAAIREKFRNIGWVYTLVGSSTPAQISDKEMKTFMLLCDVSEGTLSYHFPETRHSNDKVAIGKKAMIINGNLTGHVGIIKELPNNKYKVMLSFSSICAKVTAEVPIEFLRIL